MVVYAVVAVSFIERSTASVMAAAVWEGRGDIFIVIYIYVVLVRFSCVAMDNYTHNLLCALAHHTIYYARTHWCVIGFHMAAFKATQPLRR